MSESLHDIAMKLGLLNDVGSFKQGEKLMKDFADAALAQQRRVKEAATDLSSTDKYLLRKPESNILSNSQIEQMKQKSLFALDDKLADGTLSRQEYNKALQETVVRWNEISEAQQAHLVVLQKQQELQAISLEQKQAEIEKNQILSRAARQESQDKSLIGGLAKQYDTTMLSKASTGDRIAALVSEEGKRIDEIRKAAERSEISLTEMRKAIGAVRIEYRGMRNEVDGTNSKLREHESLVKRTHALLGTYSNMADRVSEDIETLRLAHERGIITQEKFNAASAVANERLKQVRGSSGNLVYAIGEMGRGLEDFITVMSITGFTTQGFGMAMRGASNNISQAAMLMTGGSGALIGSAMGIGAIAIGQLIPYLFRTSKAVDEVTLAYERNSEAINRNASAVSRMLDAKFKLEDISRINTSGEAHNIFSTTNPREIEKAKTEIEKLRQERITLDKRNIDSVIAPETSNLLQSSSAELQDVIAKYREAIVSGNKERIETSVKELQHHVDVYKSALMGLEEESKKTIITDGSIATAVEKTIKSGKALLDDKEKLHEIQKDITEATNKELTAKQQLIELEKQTLQAKEKYFQLLEKEETIKDNATTRDARILEQESQFRLHKQLDKDIRGNISEESYLKDLSIRYRDMMSVDWMTEGSKEALDNSFRNDLFTRENELERSLFQQQPDLAVGTSTVTEAMTNASKQMMDAQNDDKFTQQLNELKAIKEALRNNLFPVERIQ